MSEINSIANGSFVLGQTSATNFIAGPGISIDSPSAGTVRIGNDETVLWSGQISKTDQTAQLSEPLSGFKRVKLYGHRINNWQGRAMQIKEFEPIWSDNGTCYFYPVWTDMASNTIYQNMMYVSAQGTSLGFLNGWKKEGSTETTGVSSYGFWLKKVVGINRKEV